jgi:hypothetical protein
MRIFILVIIGSLLFSCERGLHIDNNVYQYSHPDSVHVFIDVIDYVNVSEFHWYYNSKGDTLQSWSIISSRECGSYGHGSCPPKMVNGELIHYRYTWSSDDCKKYCLPHNTTH